MDFIGCPPVRPATRASPSDHQRSRYTLSLIVLAISGESRSTVPFARPKKSIVTAALGTEASTAFAVVDRATKATARVKLPLLQCQLMADFVEKVGSCAGRCSMIQSLREAGLKNHDGTSSRTGCFVL